MRRRNFIAATAMTLPLTVARTRAAPVPVVLELFTSQGCSSCPPADALLGELTRRPGVIALAWHVDYWNSLGWRDPYARPEWTERQKSYAKLLRGEVYTPALIVNGTAMMVGSDKAAVQMAIDQASPLAVPVTLARTAAGLEARIAATSIPVTAVLVTYDPQQATQVGAGENQGRRLIEYRVVREVRHLDKLTTTLSVPPVSATSGAVLMLQDATWRVVGAADLPPQDGA